MPWRLAPRSGLRPSAPLHRFALRALRALWWFGGLSLLGACSGEDEPETVEPECAPNQFRACQDDACSGVEQCGPTGLWQACNCIVLDAAYADGGAGGADAASDASDAPSEG